MKPKKLKKTGKQKLSGKAKSPQKSVAAKAPRKRVKAKKGKKTQTISTKKWHFYPVVVMEERVWKEAEELSHPTEDCKNCRNRRWVCEEHLDQPWKVLPGCSCGAGAPCPKCNPKGQLMMQNVDKMVGLAIPSFRKIASILKRPYWPN